MSVITKCELCGREVGVPDYDTGLASEYCVSCKRAHIDELPGVPYFRQHPLDPSLMIMKLDGKESTIKMISRNEIIVIPDVPVPGLEREKVEKALESGIDQKQLGELPPDLLNDDDRLLAVLMLLRQHLWKNTRILDRRTVHFLDIHIDDIAPLLTEGDLKYLQYAGIKVDPEGYLYADKDSAKADERAVCDTEAHARTDEPQPCKTKPVQRLRRRKPGRRPLR